MLWLRDCADPPPGVLVGPKILRLAQALRLGVQVPQGLVIPAAEIANADELRSALRQLGGDRFAVRSSSAQEDLATRSAAGLFLSCTHVPLAEVADAVLAVRESGHSATVQRYCGGPVPVAVLIQPMVAAERLGVLYLRPDGGAVCEERSASAPEWAAVTNRALVPSDDSPLGVGARLLSTLLGPPVYIEYALAKGGAVTFLQVRPAPPQPPSPHWTTATTAEATLDLVFIHDAEHNPDPMSCAQSGVVEGVADLVPSLCQRVYRGYLYYADLSAATPGLPSPQLENLWERYTHDIVPACEALLAPLEQEIFAADGALSARLLRNPELCTLSLRAAWRAYRGVYQLYVAQLSPALRGARRLLDELLQRHLGESLLDPRNEHGALLAGSAEAPLERLQQLWELGQKGCGAAPLRAYLRHYGAFTSCWDIAAPCDDERPHWLGEMALRLAAGPRPAAQHIAAEASYQTARSKLLGRLPQAAQQEFMALLPQVRTAQRIAEEDDALFFRAQRLLRWALLRRGSLLCAAGRLDEVSAVFDLPFSLHLSHLDDFDAQAFAKGLDLRQLAAAEAAERAAARTLVPPDRLIRGQPLWTPPRGAVLYGYGVAGSEAGPVRGRAQVVRSLFPSPQAVTLDKDTILVLPVLLPSWAAELWAARALVTDSGGALSHGAILARERGVPAVVGTKAATRTIADGQEVWVDPIRGRVYLLP